MAKVNEKRQNGQSLLEFALLLPILLIILAGVLDLGRVFFSYVAVTDAAAEGAAYAAIYPTDTAGIVSRAQDASSGLVEIDENLVDVHCPNVASGQPITVTVHYTFTLATPFISGIVNDRELVLHGSAAEVILSTQ